MTPKHFTHTTGHFEGAGGIKLFYQSWKPVTGKSHAVLAVIHGMAEHSDRYRFLTDYFSQRGFTIYTMDLRGHGQSKGRRVYADSLDQFLIDIENFLRVIRKDEPRRKIYLIGHSFGGQLVLNYGAHAPNGLSGIILSSPNIRLRVKVPTIKLKLAPILARWLPILALGNELDASMVSHDPLVVEEYKRDKKVARKITTRLANIVLSNQEKIAGLAPKFRVPCLLMHAGDDLICAPEGTKDFFEKIPVKDKTLRIYEGFYHELFNEVERDRVFRDMEAWLEKRI